MKASQGNRHITGTNWERVCSWFVFLFFFTAFCVNISGDFLNLSEPQIKYQSWEISEWLINYEGGFVRRGLLGQILLALEQVRMYDVRIAVRLLYTLSSLGILCILYRVFKGEGWSPLLLLTGLCVGYTLFNPWGRKDFLMLALTFVIFHCYRSAIASPHRRTISWVLFYALAALQLLIHEASFFFTIPILMLYSYSASRTSKHSRLQSAMHCFVRFLPVLAVMAMVCLFKGSKSTADAIWASWGGVFTVFPDPDGTSVVGASVQALGWDTVTTFDKHFYHAYFGVGAPSVHSVFLTLFVMVSAYYLLTRIDSVFMGKSRPKPLNHTLLSNVALIQFVSLIPMFTVLSCDWGRTLPYWVISTLFFYHVFKHEAGPFPRIVTRTSQAIQNFISSNRLLRSPYFYLLLVLLTPVPNYFAPLDHLNTIQQRHYAYLLDLIHQIATSLT